jgi:hypothetical protein
MRSLTNSPQNWHKTQQKRPPALPSSVPHTTHTHTHTHLDLAQAIQRQCSDNKKVHPSSLTSDAQKTVIFKVGTSSSPQRSYYIKDICCLCFSVSRIQTVSVASAWHVLRMEMVKEGSRHGGWLRIYWSCNRVDPKKKAVLQLRR